LQIAIFLETLEAGDETTCRIDGLANDDLNPFWQILRQNWSESRIPDHDSCFLMIR